MVTDIMKMHSFYLFLILVTSWRWSMAQDVSKFKILDDSAYQSNIEYLSGNKYQKDAILIMSKLTLWRGAPVPTPEHWRLGQYLVQALCTSRCRYRR